MPRSREDKISAGSIYEQEQCANCGTVFFTDQLAEGDGGQMLCHPCFSELAVSRSSFNPIQIRVPIVGISLLEVLLIAGIIGALLSVVVRPLMDLRQLGDSRALELLVFQSENQALAGLAFDFVEGGEQDWSKLIGNAAAAAGISDEDMVEFEDEIANYKNHDSQDAQAGSIIKTIQEWKEKVIAKQTPDPLLEGDGKSDIDLLELFSKTETPVAGKTPVAQ